MKRKLPIGIQDFAKLRRGGYVYADKTERIYELVADAAGPVFLSRPRRFGKSLLCSTLAALFEGKRELFEGLAINSLDWDWKNYPVIRLDLNPGNYAEGIDTLSAMLQNNLESSAAKLGLALRGTVLAEKFMNLIIDAKNKYNQSVVILIDEYDKPLLSTVDNADLYRKLRDILKGFYGVLKSADEYLEFVLLTGVTKFSQVSVFSELNNLTDISFNRDYYDLCGITQPELENIFEPEITEIIGVKNIDKQTYLSQLKHFYNGYRFAPNVQTVYNPFGLLNHFFNKGQFNSYWFATGTPTFLIKLIENQKIDILKLENGTLTFDDFQRFDVDNLNAVSVLYQSGYLTIVGYEEGIFTLDYPNEEVRSAFAKSLLEYYVQKSANGTKPPVAAVSSSLVQGDAEKALCAIKSLFASIPYDIQINEEKYYQTVVHLVFRMLGLYCISEMRTADGRIDCLVETKKYVYCFEFKMDKNGSAEDALAQIESKNYLLQWKENSKKLFKIGVEFDYEKRNIGKWVIAEI